MSQDYKFFCSAEFLWNFIQISEYFIVINSMCFLIKFSNFCLINAKSHYNFSKTPSRKSEISKKIFLRNHYFKFSNCKVILQFVSEVPINGKFFRVFLKRVCCSHFWTLFHCLSKNISKYSQFFFKISV